MTDKIEFDAMAALRAREGYRPDGEPGPGMDAALADAAAETAALPTDEQLRQLAATANELKRHEDLIAAREAELDNLKAAKRLIETRDLPDKLRELGLQSFKLADGSEVGVKTVVSCSVAAINRAAVNDWLRTIGQEDLIKHTITTKLIRGQEEQAHKLTAVLAQLHLEFVDDERVHPQTMSAWVRHRVLRGEGDQLPKDLLGLFIGQVATVTRPKSE